MLELVNFSCGHSVKVQLSDNPEKREAKKAELELSGLCPECRKADCEKQDAEHAKGCVCCRIQNDKLDNFPGCEKRLTGYPKEKDFTYIYVPVEIVCAEAFKKIIKAHDCSFDDAVDLMEKAFAKKYPEYYQKLKPVELDDDDLYSDNPVNKEVNSANSVNMTTGNADFINKTPSEHEKPVSTGKQEPEKPADMSDTEAKNPDAPENPVNKVRALNVGPYMPEETEVSAVAKPAAEEPVASDKSFIDEFFDEKFDDIAEAKLEISSAPQEIPVGELMKNPYVIQPASEPDKKAPAETNTSDAAGDPENDIEAFFNSLS